MAAAKAERMTTSYLLAGGSRWPRLLSPISMRRCGKYSFHRRVTSAAVSGSHSTSFGNHGFIRASMRIGGV